MSCSVFAPYGMGTGLAMETSDRQVLYEAVEGELGHTFSQKELLLQALTHSSYCNEEGLDPLKDNERLEFLGDAVIGLVVAEMLMVRHPEATEGRLSRARSEWVSRKALAEIAWQAGYGEWVLLGRGERQTGGSEKASILAGVLEAVVGALYLDGGLDAAKRYLAELFGPWLEAAAWGTRGQDQFADKKTLLQERTQSLYKSTPFYRVVDSWGKEHEKVFRVAIEIQGRVIAEGEGRSKKDAEQNAAHSALGILENI